MSKDNPASKVRARSKRRGRPARAWPERIDADPEEVMRVADADAAGRLDHGGASGVQNGAGPR